MAAHRLLTGKQMIDVYLNIDDQNEAQAFWDALVCLRDYGFISPCEWGRFFDRCHEYWLSRS